MIHPANSQQKLSSGQTLSWSGCHGALEVKTKFSCPVGVYLDLARTDWKKQRQKERKGKRSQEQTRETEKRRAGEKRNRTAKGKEKIQNEKEGARWILIFFLRWASTNTLSFNNTSIYDNFLAASIFFSNQCFLKPFHQHTGFQAKLHQLIFQKSQLRTKALILLDWRNFSGISGVHDVIPFVTSLFPRFPQFPHVTISKTGDAHQAEVQPQRAAENANRKKSPS